MEILRQVGLAVAVLGGLGALFGLALAVANRVFYVETDSRLEPLMQALPGANCGGCGFSGCGAYAQAVLAAKRRWAYASPEETSAPRLWPPSWASKRKRLRARWRSCAVPELRRGIRGSMRGFPIAWPLQRWPDGGRSFANSVAWASAIAPRCVSLTPFTWRTASPGGPGSVHRLYELRRRLPTAYHCTGALWRAHHRCLLLHSPGLRHPARLRHWMHRLFQMPKDLSEGRHHGGPKPGPGGLSAVRRVRPVCGDLPSGLISNSHLTPCDAGTVIEQENPVP